MTEIDPELRDKIIETHTDMRHVRKKLEAGAETFKEHDERLRGLEQNQSKIMAIVVGIGSIITLGLNGALYLFGKLWK